ncbi:response regulator [Paenisporosarcina quisquiliarum]|uniref:response regulator n=1 Tax=Paenisporosarcina quisquiliarum TaxID=365346 RepID=UPI003734EC78
MEPIRLGITDDHEMVRLGLVSYFLTEPGIEVVGEAKSGMEGIALAKEHMPDVMLMDLLMENGSGIEATKEILAFHPTCKIMILTSYYDEEQVFPALEAGAFSYLLKTLPAEKIAEAVRDAVNGQATIAPKVTDLMMKKLRPKDRMLHDDLTEREIDVLKCLGDGLSNQEIGEKLFIGVKTVKTHVSNILAKLELTDRTQAAVYANRHGILHS